MERGGFDLRAAGGIPSLQARDQLLETLWLSAQDEVELVGYLPPRAELLLPEVHRPPAKGKPGRASHHPRVPLQLLHPEVHKPGEEQCGGIVVGFDHLIIYLLFKKYTKNGLNAF